MGVPWVILVVPFLIESGICMSVVPGDSTSNNWTQNDNSYTTYMEENNHVEGADHLLLFYLTDVTEKPSCTFASSDNFQYDNTIKSDKGYEFRSAQYFDYETQPSSYTLLCKADDEQALIQIYIVNIDDEPPTLTSPMCSMKENVKYDLTNTDCTCILTDPDGWLSQTTFTIINSNPKAAEDLEMEDRLFKFDFDKSIPDSEHSTTVSIITLKTLDYETRPFYSFNVQAKDGAQHPTTPNENVACFIDVIDQNDMPPKWTDYFTTEQIIEKKRYNFTVLAVDGDRGINADINYSIISYDEDVCGPDPCVSITKEGEKGILTVEPIDRDTMDLLNYKFEIMAQEVDDPPFTANITVTFYIEDIDDNSPLFMSVTTTNSTNINYTDIEPKIAEFTFYENFAGTIDGKIEIKDVDTGLNAQFNVYLMEDESENRIIDNTEVSVGEDDIYIINYTDAFMVVPTAGYRSGDFQITVKNATYLDFENPPWQNFQFYIHSEGFLDPDNRKDDLLVRINLLDYNDEPPIFEQSSYSVSKNETIGIGEEIIQVKATDRDAEDKELTHTLIAADTISKLLYIDEVDGIVTVAQENAFDYDRINPIIFQVKATDKAIPPHETTVPVTLNLLDVNNKAPTYESGMIITVDENQNIGVPLNSSITASDVDTTRKLVAEINWDKSYVTKNSQRLDKSDPVIQNAMQFLDLDFKEISADSIEIALIVNDNNEEGTAPDYETFDTLYLYIKITDLNTQLPEFEDKMSIDAVIVININDINDNPPVFTDETLTKNRTVYEKSDDGIIVGSIQAIDADVGDIVTYSCSFIEEKYDWFTCDLEGTITVSTKNGAIDCDTDRIPSVNISCIATDGVHDTPPQEFSIYILDRNNKYPYIKVNETEPSAPVVEIEEKSEQYAVVTKIATPDADRDIPFHTVECSFHPDEDKECYSQFMIQNNEVVVKNDYQQLDRDSGPDHYDCTVYCVDNPNLEQDGGQNSNNTKFTIKLLDINDHCPELAWPSEMSTREDVMKDTVIGEIIATDADLDDNSEIDIRISSVIRDIDNEEVDLFDTQQPERDIYYINGTYKRWNLIAKRDLRDFYGDYTIQLYMIDHGNPPISTEDPGYEDIKERSKIKVTVSKHNYFEPIFLFPDETNPQDNSYTLTMIQEVGTPLKMFLNNEDFPDINIATGENDQCLEKWEPAFGVTLSGASSGLVNVFDVITQTRCTTQLQVNEYFTGDQPKSYELSLWTKLSNDTEVDGEALYKSVDLKISFADPESDPVFNSSIGVWNFSLPEKNLTASQPLEYKAYYPNVDLSMSIFYSLFTEDENVDDTFDVDINTGTVSLKHELDYLDINYYEFQIYAAKNRGHKPTANSPSLLKVSVDVEDINDHTPQWTQNTFFGAIMPFTPNGATIVTIEATDLDTMDQNNLHYIQNTTIEPHGSSALNVLKNPFKLNEITGDITLNFVVEPNMNGYFLFTVYVEDNPDQYGNGPNSNVTTVTIYFVTTENTFNFDFENGIDDVVEQKLQILSVISDALDWNCHDYTIEKKAQNGVELGNVTTFTLYCEKDNVLFTSNDIKSKLNNLDIYKGIKQNLVKVGLLMSSLSSNSTKLDNLEAQLKAALIAVSVVLGSMTIILAITFILKIRGLNKKLKQLTVPKFGSDESDLNRKGITAPGTNLYASGSNPVFNQDIKRDDYDKSSIHSGDSELIGVEDNPEFDGIFSIDTAKEKF